LYDYCTVKLNEHKNKVILDLHLIHLLHQEKHQKSQYILLFQHPHILFKIGFLLRSFL